MNFSGVLKAFKDFVTGTPTDTDYFLFGNTDIKKISLSNLKTALGIAALNSSLNNIQTGTVSAKTCPPGEITDYPVTFPKAFSKTPIITIGMYSGTTNADYGNVSYFYYDVTATGFTLRVANKTSSNISPAFRYIAIEK